MFQILEIADVKVGQKTNYCLNISLVFPILSTLIDISMVIIKRMQEGNKSLGILKNVQFERKIFTLSPAAYCCRKTAVCNTDQLLDFSVPELVRSQSKFSTDPEVLQNCQVLHCAVHESSSRRMFCSNGLTPCICMVCVLIYYVLCVLDYYLLNSQL